MVEALLRTGEIEDMLEDPRARFTGLSIDIGDQDQHELKEYIGGFDERLDSSGASRPTVRRSGPCRWTCPRRRIS